jgi:hypothetical protein
MGTAKQETFNITYYTSFFIKVNSFIKFLEKIFISNVKKLAEFGKLFHIYGVIGTSFEILCRISGNFCSMSFASAIWHFAL